MSVYESDVQTVFYSKSKVKRGLSQKIKNILENTHCDQRFFARDFKGFKL